jgi:hypothetical protein
MMGVWSLIAWTSVVEIASQLTRRSAKYREANR